MTPHANAQPQPAPGQVAARVIATHGTWACLWIPQTGQTTWVDLSEVEFEAS